MKCRPELSWNGNMNGSPGEDRCAALTINQCREMGLTKFELSLVLLAKSKNLDVDSPNERFNESCEIYQIFAKDHLDILKVDPDQLFTSMLDSRSKDLMQQSIKDALTTLGISQSNPKFAPFLSVVMESERHDAILLTASSMLFASLIKERRTEVEAARYLIKKYCISKQPSTSDEALGLEGCIAAGLVLEGSMQLADELRSLWISFDDKSKHNFIRFLAYANNDLSVELLLRFLESDEVLDKHFGTLVAVLADMPGDAKRAQGNTTPNLLSNSYESTHATGAPTLKTVSLGTFSSNLSRIQNRIEALERKVENKEPVRLIIKAWKEDGLDGFAAELNMKGKGGCAPLLFIVATAATIGAIICY